ncbi:MAG: diguanylate cyclase [Lachnospiraceae bacterium]|nr:diguanylate cyclase [Lachnospiraceae bacterium]
MEFHIAVVDDDATSLMSARKILTDDGMRVSCLRSGEDLLKYMHKHDPDIILLDVMMQGLDGFETFDRLRKLEEEMERNYTPVIFLTGEEEVEIERQGLMAGAADFIRKPLVKDVSIRRIVNAISNNRKIESLSEEVMTDKLTGFLNKASGTEKVSEAVRDTEGMLMILDLDNFKLVNDLFGHDAGDKVLVAFSNIVRKNTRDNDIQTRIGGDEFMVFLPGVTEESRVATLTHNINAELSLEATIIMGEGHGIPLGVSVGAVSVPLYGRDYEDVFEKADTSLYKAKKNGKHAYSFYSDREKLREEIANDPEKEMDRVLKIMQERNIGNSALFLSPDAFGNVYRFVMRFNMRNKKPAACVIFSINPTYKNDDPSLEYPTDRFLDILRNSLRKSDVIMQNRKNQFFVLLPELAEYHDVDTVTSRVINKWDCTEESKEYKVTFYENDIIF